MKTPERNEHRDAAAIEAEAMAWLAEQDEGFGPGRAAAFEAWRRSDPRHAASIAELEQVLGHLEGLSARRDEVNARFDRVSPPPPTAASAPTAGTHGWWPAAWCGLAAALAVGGFFGFRAVKTVAGPEIRYVTTTAGYERARLGDGSTLELNTASAARVRFTASERRVELDSGEAHFEVVHDSMRPFVVSAGGVAVRAIGTAFNVRFVADAVEVTVTEGKVTVAPAAASGRSGVKPDPTGHAHGERGVEPPSPGATVLSANERLAVSLSSVTSRTTARPHTIERLRPAEVRAALAWQRGVTDFSDTPLAEVVARFNRHNVLQLVIVDPALGPRRIGGFFALDDVEAFVRLLERDGIVQSERDGDTLRLRRP